MCEEPWRVVHEVPCPDMALGPHGFDLRHRALVVGVLDPPADARELDPLLTRAAQLVLDGADALTLAVPPAAAEGTVHEVEELDLVIPTIAALQARFDVPLVVESARAAVVREAFAAGAVVARDSSGFRDPDYLPAAAAAGASVIAAHAAGPDADESMDTVCDQLRRRADEAEAAGIPHERVLVDAGLDLGLTVARSLELLRAHDGLARLGWPVVLAAALPGEGREAALAAQALAIALGCRVLWARDVRGARRTAAVMAAVLEARTTVQR